MTPKVLAVLTPVLAALGAEADPVAWVVWGDEPATRYMVLVPTANGLILSHVRPNIPGEGARVSAKLVRWPKVTVGELAIETSQGHRLISLPIEGAILRGVDDEATRIAQFARLIIAGSDGQPWPAIDDSPPTRGRRRPAAGGTPTKARPAAKPRPVVRPAPAPARSATSRG